MKEEMATEPDFRWPPRPGKRVAALSTAQLVAGLTGELKELIRKELELAKTEARVDIKAGLKSFRWLGSRRSWPSLAFVNLLCVALALWLARACCRRRPRSSSPARLPRRAVIFALLGRASFVRPLESTRKTLSESWAWARNRIA